MKFSKSKILKFEEGRIFRPFLYAGLFLLSTYSYAEPDSKLIFSFDSFNYSETTSIHSISGSWDDDISEGDTALSVSRMTLGVEYKNYSFEAIVRNDSYYGFDNETAQFIYLTENKIALENGRDYVLYIKPDKSSSSGLRLGMNQLITPNLKLSGFFSFLKPTDLVHGELNGHAMAIDSNDYDFNFSSELYYQEDPLFDRETGSIEGYGYSIDVIVDYRINETWSINLELLDVVGELFIDQAAYTRAEATSDIKVFDDNGYLTYDPVISGIESNKNFVYQFNLQTHLSVSYQLSDKNNLIFEHYSLAGFDYQKLSLLQRVGQNQLSWILIPQLSSAGIKFENPNFSIGLETDSLDYKKMKYLSITSQLSWAF